MHSSLATALFCALLVCSLSRSSLAQQKEQQQEKRGAPPSRNPYSWRAGYAKRAAEEGEDGSALLMDEAEKRAPFGSRHPQNPYSWMSAAPSVRDDSSLGWMFLRLRPFSGLVSKRLGSFRRNPYSWMNQ